MFLRNYWYVAAESAELKRKLVKRTLLGEMVVMYRTKGGKPVVLEDRCAHRRLPLSMGRLDGDCVECAYHGLVYEPSGACVKIPGQDRIKPGTGVRSYPLAERHGWVWIWMGEPERADESQIPDFKELVSPDWKKIGGYLHVQGNYLLIADNLLDLSHLAYVHGETSGNPAVAENAEVSTRRRGDRVIVERRMFDIPSAPMFVKFTGYKKNYNRWQYIEFMPPAHFRINNGIVATDMPIPKGDLGDKRGDLGWIVYHGITPETETTTHQFWGLVHQFDLGRHLKPFHTQAYRVMQEDYDVYTEQQRAVDRDPDAPVDDVNAAVEIKADTGLLQARRIVKRLLKAEAKPRRGKPAKRKAA